jgi:hypothetical protein
MGRHVIDSAVIQSEEYSEGELSVQLWSVNQGTTQTEEVTDS